jgi:hypothetical protein
MSAADYILASLMHHGLEQQSTCLPAVPPMGLDIPVPEATKAPKAPSAIPPLPSPPAGAAQVVLQLNHFIHLAQNQCSQTAPVWVSDLKATNACICRLLERIDVMGQALDKKE